MAAPTTRRARSSTLTSTLEPLSESVIASLHPRPLPTRQHSFKLGARHRHSADADAALELLQTLAEQATRPRLEDGREGEVPADQVRCSAHESERGGG